MRNIYLTLGETLNLNKKAIEWVRENGLERYIHLSEISC